MHYLERKKDRPMRQKPGGHIGLHSVPYHCVCKEGQCINVVVLQGVKMYTHVVHTIALATWQAPYPLLWPSKGTTLLISRIIHFYWECMPELYACIVLCYVTLYPRSRTNQSAAPNDISSNRAGSINT